MKKLMIAAAVVCAVAVSQAASIKWSSGTAIQGPKSATDGTFNGTSISTSSLKMYAWVFQSDGERQAALESSKGDIWAAYKSGALDSAVEAINKKEGGHAWAADSGALAKGSVGAGATTDFGSVFSTSADTTYYAITLLTYDQDTTKAGEEWYIANQAQSTVNTAGKGVNLSNLGKKVGGTGDAITGWTAAASVPEPTSGLLMLLGVAGLALRRRRA